MFAFYTHYTTFNEPITTYIEEFEIKWTRLYDYISSANPGSYKATYRTMLEMNQYKRETVSLPSWLNTTQM